MPEPEFDWLYGPYRGSGRRRDRPTALDGGPPIVPCAELPTEPATPPSVDVKVQISDERMAPGWLARAMRRIWGGR